MYVTGLKRRILRFKWIFGLGIALLVPMTQGSASHAQTTATVLPTQTILQLDARGLAGAAQTTATVSVLGANGQPATGVVNFDDGNRTSNTALPLAGKCCGCFWRLVRTYC